MIDTERAFDHDRFSALLDALKDHEGITYPEVARRLRVSRHALWALRSGRSEPSFRTYARIVEQLDLDQGDLIRSGAA